MLHFIHIIIFFSGSLTYAYVLPFVSFQRMSKLAATSVELEVEKAPYDDIIPFLSEHVQPADQMLFVGARTDLSLQLSKNGYGTQNTGFIKVVDSNPNLIRSLHSMAQNDPILRENIANNQLSFVTADLTDMSEVCTQSIYDAIVDYKGLDELLSDPTREEEEREMRFLACIDHLQNSVRLGNILVSLSLLPKSKFCTPFDSRFGWVNELDGDPGALSAWYRDGKSNIAATGSNFKSLGLFMYVYTNTDNC